MKSLKFKENENLKMAGKGIGNKDGIINKTDLYYYQIQQQAFVAERNIIGVIL